MEENNQLIINAVLDAKNGIDSGFTYLYEQTYWSKYYVALKYMNNDQDAQDVLQIAYARAFQNLHLLDNPASFSAWMSKIVSNTAINELKKKRPMVFSELDSENAEGEDLVFQIEDERSEFNPEMAYSKQETAELVQMMLGSLSEEQKMAVVMFYLEGLSIKEIAEAMECSENTVKSRLNYGRKKLQEVCNDMEQKGYKLFSVSPILMLIYLLQTESAAYTGGATYAGYIALTAGGVGASYSAVAGGMAYKEVIGASGIGASNMGVSGIGASGVGAYSETIGASGVGAYNGAIGASGFGTYNGAVGASGVGTSQATGTFAMGDAAGKTVAAAAGKSIGAKIAIAVLGSVLAGSTLGGILYYNHQKKEKAKTTEQTTIEQVVGDDSTTETGANSQPVDARSLYKAHVQDVLIPEYGLIDEEKTQYINWDDKNANIDCVGGEGLLSVFYDDTDGDGVEEMLTVRMTSDPQDGNEVSYLKRYVITDIYTIVENEVVKTTTEPHASFYYSPEYALPDSIAETFLWENSNTSEACMMYYTTTETNKKILVVYHYNSAHYNYRDDSDTYYVYEIVDNQIVPQFMTSYSHGSDVSGGKSVAVYENGKWASNYREHYLEGSLDYSEGTEISTDALWESVGIFGEQSGGVENYLAEHPIVEIVPLRTGEPGQDLFMGSVQVKYQVTDYTNWQTEAPAQSQPDSVDASEEQTANENPNLTDNYAATENQRQYISNIIQSPNRRIWYLTYGNAKDSKIDKMYITEGNRLYYVDVYNDDPTFGDLTLGDVAKKSDDAFYSEIMEKIKNKETEYAIYDLDKLVVVCRTDSLGNYVLYEDLILPISSVLEFRMSYPAVEITLPFTINNGAGPNEPNQALFCPTTIYDTPFIWYSFGKKYLYSKTEDPQLVVGYYSDDYNENMVSSILMDVDSSEVVCSEINKEGNIVRFKTHDGSWYYFANQEVLGDYESGFIYYCPNATVVLPWDNN